MKMYIANCTKQPHDFIYRLPEEGKVRKQHIKELSQTLLSGDFNVKEIEGIIQQHKRYGFVNVGEIDQTKVFSGLCYSLDKAIPAAKMLKLLNHNVDVLVEMGKENRKEAAVAVSNEINEKVGGLGNLEVEIIEDTKGNRDESGIEEHLRITEHVGRGGELIPRGERETKPRRNRQRKAKEE